MICALLQPIPLAEWIPNGHPVVHLLYAHDLKDIHCHAKCPERRVAIQLSLPRAELLVNAVRRALTAADAESQLDRGPRDTHEGDMTPVCLP
jgi:hypothetical protein